MSAHMSVELTIQNPAQAPIPDEKNLVSWISLALGSHANQAVTLRIVDLAEIQQLNKQFRNKDKPTNVLSFPNAAPIEVSDGFLGDMVICSQVIEQEAQAQNKALEAHWAHMVIHSTLHLLGLDHQTQEDAKHMESLEIQCLTQLGYPNPYEAYHG